MDMIELIEAIEIDLKLSVDELIHVLKTMRTDLNELREEFDKFKNRQ